MDKAAVNAMQSYDGNTLGEDAAANAHARSDFLEGGLADTRVARVAGNACAGSEFLEENGCGGTDNARVRDFSSRRICGARTRAGHPCPTPAMPNGRCRMHGGNNPGAPKGNKNAWKHGRRSGEHRAWRLLLRAMRAELADA